MGSHGLNGSTADHCYACSFPASSFNIEALRDIAYLIYFQFSLPTNGEGLGVGLTSMAPLPSPLREVERGDVLI